MGAEKISSNSIIEGQLDEHLRKLEKIFEGNAIALISPIEYGIDDILRESIECITNRKDRLIVILETPGGIIEATQRIAELFRKHFKLVEFVVPNYAFSAGTVLVMSGDFIHMDYYSRLGPIDPQVRRIGTGLVPALGYLIQYDRLIEKSHKGRLSSAEITYLVEKFDPAELYKYEQARNLSITLLKEWLVNFKFKNWNITRTRRKTVTPSMKTKRADQIAKMLNKIEHWHSHGRGISIDILTKDIKLEIEDYGKDEKRSNTIKLYYKLLKDYMIRRGHKAVVHSHCNYVPVNVD